MRGIASQNENLQSILNSFQYVHSSLILILIVLHESEHQDEKSRLSTLVSERTKKRKMGFLNKQTDKLLMLKKFNDILHPQLQIL